MSDKSPQAKYFSSEFLNNTVRYGLITVGVLGALLSLAGDFTQSNALLQSYVVEQANVVCVVLHLILIALILGPARVRPLDTDIHNPYVRASAMLMNRHFLPAWRGIWIFFGMLYVLLLFTAQDLHVVRPITDPKWMYDHKWFEQVLLNLGDLASSWAIALCATFLAPRFLRREVFSLARKEKDLREGPQHFEPPHVGPSCFPKVGHWWLYLSLLFGMLMIFTVFTRYWALYWSVEWNHLNWIVDMCIGLISAVVMGMLAGRLDSPFIANWMWVVVLLYAYAFIQPFNNVLEGDDRNAEVMFLYAAFSLKCVWFIFVSDMFADRRILYYAYETLMPELERKV